jgi:hypothetical protein
MDFAQTGPNKIESRPYATTARAPECGKEFEPRQFRRMTTASLSVVLQASVGLWAELAYSRRLRRRTDYSSLTLGLYLE